MKFEFSDEKNYKLVKERNISFKEVITAIEAGAILGVVPNPNGERYPNQKAYVLNIRDYACVVPFSQKDESTIFLKTIFFSRKMTRRYLRK